MLAAAVFCVSLVVVVVVVVVRFGPRELMFPRTAALLLLHGID